MSIRKNIPLSILLLFSIFHSAKVFAQIPPINFEQINNQPGLLSNTIFCAVQDRLGFMWFGTEKGLSRFDGKHFHTFLSEENNPNSLRNNTIRSLLTDEEDNLWIGTQGGGLSKYHIPSRTFIHYQHNAANSKSINHNEILSLYKGSRGFIWVGTEEGLNAFNPNTEEFHRIRNQANKEGTSEAAAVLDLAEDSKGNLWVAVWQGGVRKLNWNQTEAGLSQARFEDFSYDENSKHTLPSKRITSLSIDANDRIWAGSYGHGLSFLPGKSCDKEEGLSYKIPSKNRQGFGNNIYTTLIDSRGLLWIGTSKDLQVTNPSQIDLCKVHEGKSLLPFKKFKHTHTGTSGLPSGSIRGIFENREGIIWIASEGGIAKYDPRVSVFESYIIRKEHELNPVGGYKSIFISKENGTWLASKEGLLNYSAGKITKVYSKESTGNFKLPSNNIIFVQEDTLNKVLWMASSSHISKVDLGTQRITHKSLDLPLTHKRAYISRLYFSTKGNIWVSTHQGLFILNQSLEKVHFYKHDPKNPTSLPKGRVYNIREDNQGNYWIGTELGGLVQAFPQKDGTFIFNNHLPFPQTPSSLKNKYFFSILPTDDKVWIGSSLGFYSFDKKTQHFNFYDKDKGLNVKGLNHLQQDKKGYIWGVANEAIIRFDPNTEVFFHFDYRNGLAGANFGYYISFQDPAGKIYFGSDKGMLVVDPLEVDLDFDLPKLHLTELILNGKIIEPNEAPKKSDGPAILTKRLSETQKITLGPEHRMIQLNLSAIQYHLSDKNQTAYKLEGFEEEWKLSGADANISYMNLAPGEYKLYTKGANSNGKWGKEQLSLEIEILPSFWETIYFKILAACLLVGLVLGIYQLRSRQVLRQNRLLQQKVEDRTKALKLAHELERQARSRAEQAVLAKSQFLANMSHEIRTPMNGVLGMAELLNDDRLQTDQKDYIETIIKSGENLLAIINDILDLSKIESGKLELEENPFNLRDSIEEVLGLFAGKILAKPIELLYHLEKSLPEIILADKLRLQQVLINLVGNALKFTESGEIFVEVKAVSSSKGSDLNTFHIAFSVKDTGIGIPVEKQEVLFDSFTQVDASTTRKYGGTGLGLSISSHLVKLMGGSLRVKSKVGIGSTFYFSIETKKEALYLEKNSGLPLGNSLSGKKVLVIDTSPKHSKLLVELLESWEIEVTQTKNLTELSEVENVEIFEGIISNFSFCSTSEGDKFIPWKKQHPNLKGIHLSPLIAVQENNSLGIFEEVLPKPVKRKALLDSLTKLLTNSEAPTSGIDSTASHPSQTIKSEVKILLAEDNPVNQKLAMRVLQKLGFQPSLAENGMEVLSFLEKEPVDIILMDLQMPKLDGLEATRRIRKNPEISPQPFIIAMTANAMKGDKEMCMDAGMNDYISKPFKQKALKDLLDLHIEKLPEATQI